jgi:hypothetical protein
VKAPPGSHSPSMPVLVGKSIHKFLDPGDIMVDPVLDELFAGDPDVPILVKQSFIHLDEGLRLSESWHVEIGKNIAQMLLRHSRSDQTGGHTYDAGWLARPDIFAPWTRALVDCVFESARDRAVVLGRDKQDALCSLDFSLHPFDRIGWMGVVIRVVKRQVVDPDKCEGEIGRGKPDKGVSQLPVERFLAEAADQDGDLIFFYGGFLFV